jgi:hypothetical protein
MVDLSHNYTQIAHPVHFPEPILLSPLFGESCQYRILKAPMPYFLFKGAEPIVVPKGFVTDYASIPRIFWSWIPAWGRYGPAAILHDYLYSGERKRKVIDIRNPNNFITVNRYIADLYFYVAMRQLEVFWLKRNLMYGAVRLCGWPHYAGKK